MGEISNELQSELLNRIKALLPDAEYTSEFAGGDPIIFDDHCGCYSEWTTESCSLTVALKGRLPLGNDAQWNLRQTLEILIQGWAHGTLEWQGCDCCGGELYASVRLYDAARAMKVGP